MLADPPWFLLLSADIHSNIMKYLYLTCTGEFVGKFVNN